MFLNLENFPVKAKLPKENTLINFFFTTISTFTDFHNI